MAVSVKILDDRAAAAWDRFVHECPDATFFHRAGWKRVISGAFDQRAHYLYAERDGQIVGVLPLIHMRSPLLGNRLVSTAFTVGGGIAAMDEEIAAALDAEAIRIMDKSGADYLEYRQPARPHSQGQGWVAKDGVHATFSRLIADGEDECLKQIPRKQRAVVRKALESGVVDELDHDPERFFPLFAYSMRGMGTPVFGLRFFRLLHAEFGRDVDCLTVVHDGRPVSSVMSFYFRDRVMPYFVGSLPEARDLGANDLVYFRLMRRALARDCTTFDFGRSKVDSGPYSFKKNWGFTPRPVVHEYRMAGGSAIPEINVTNPKYQMFIALWKRLPMPVANRLGPLVLRHIG